MVEFSQMRRLAKYQKTRVGSLKSSLSFQTKKAKLMRKPIVTIKLFKDAGSLRGFADLTLPTKYGEITIHRFKVLQEGKRRPWVAFPQISYSRSFQIHYWPLLQVSKKLERKIKSWILSEYRRIVKWSPFQVGYSWAGGRTAGFTGNFVPPPVPRISGTRVDLSARGLILKVAPKGTWSLRILQLAGGFGRFHRPYECCFISSLDSYQISVK